MAASYEKYMQCVKADTETASVELKYVMLHYASY